MFNSNQLSEVRERLWEVSMSRHYRPEALDDVVMLALNESPGALQLNRSPLAHQFKNSDQSHFIPIIPPHGNRTRGFDPSQFDDKEDKKDQKRRNWVKRAAIATGIGVGAYLIARSVGPFHREIREFEQRIKRAWSNLRGHTRSEADSYRQNASASLSQHRQVSDKHNVVGSYQQSSLSRAASAHAASATTAPAPGPAAMPQTPPPIPHTSSPTPHSVHSASAVSSAVSKSSDAAKGVSSMISKLSQFVNNVRRDKQLSTEQKAIILNIMGKAADGNATSWAQVQSKKFVDNFGKKESIHSHIKRLLPSGLKTMDALNLLGPGKSFAAFGV